MPETGGETMLRMAALASNVVASIAIKPFKRLDASPRRSAGGCAKSSMIRRGIPASVARSSARPAIPPHATDATL
jgi:hypothetical protein